jgi:excisionase family DNA binding protein
MTAAAAAQRLGVSTAMVRHMIRRGELSAQRFGRWYLLQRKDVAALVPRRAAVMTTAEAAQRLGVSARVVRHLIWRGELSARKLGRSYVLQRREVEALVAKRAAV